MWKPAVDVRQPGDDAHGGVEVLLVDAELAGFAAHVQPEAARHTRRRDAQQHPGPATAGRGQTLHQRRFVDRLDHDLADAGVERGADLGLGLARAGETDARCLPARREGPAHLPAGRHVKEVDDAVQPLQQAVVGITLDGEAQLEAATEGGAHRRHAGADLVDEVDVDRCAEVPRHGAQHVVHGHRLTRHAAPQQSPKCGRANRGCRA